jgi:Cu/Ag efflux protein CusF
MQMATRSSSLALMVGLGLGLVLPLPGRVVTSAWGQAAAPAAVAKLGTVKSVSADTVLLTTDAGQAVTVSVPSGARIVQLAVGSTDLKTAKPSQFSDIAVGDRVLANGAAGDAPDSLTAKLVVVMKSADIAQMQAGQQADWKARGTGGIVTAVDPATGAITITAGAKKLVVNTSAKTEFRRSAGDSVKYQDAKPGTIADIRVGDQLQARGAKSADGSSMQAEEVVSGDFKDLSGSILSVDAASGKITLKDLAMKKVVTVNVTSNSDLRNLPAQMATRFAARTTGGAGAAGAAGAGGGAAAGGPDGARRSAGADLSQMMGRLPTIKLADLHKGDAVMIVASEPSPGASTLTAITVLTGVDPILDANPNGGMSLSMSMGGGAPE